jgi:hypothetical protein
VPEEAAVLDREERGDQVGIDFGERHPTAQTPVAGARSAELEAVTIL